MSTKMGFWRWALACIAILIATGPAGARVIDPTGVSTTDPAAIVVYPAVKGGPQYVHGGTCSLTPDIACTGNADCAGGCEGGFCNLAPSVACTSDADCPGAGGRHDRPADQHLGVPDQGGVQLRQHQRALQQLPTTICTDENFRTVCPRGGFACPGGRRSTSI